MATSRGHTKECLMSSSALNFGGKTENVSKARILEAQAIIMLSIPSPQHDRIQDNQSIFDFFSYWRDLKKGE